ncbi:hypothetical protein FACS1894181_01060 [Bacteroidia bacterium]|nr:hypothetical protein FACS1894181_01060 [Bacteroidia bacterium]
MQSGQYIPGLKLANAQDLVSSAKITSDGTFELSELPEDGTWKQLNRVSAMLLPFTTGKTPQFTFPVKAAESTTVKVGLYTAKRYGNYTPEVCLSEKEYPVPAGESLLKVDFKQSLKKEQYALVIFNKNEKVSIAQTNIRLSGVLSLFHSWSQKQNDQYGIEEIPFYVPERRPGGKNFAMKVTPAIKSFATSQLGSGVFRPANGRANAWIAPLAAKTAQLKCEWNQPQEIRKIVLWFDSDFDHAMESCLMGHPENIMPLCVQQYKILDDAGHTIYEVSDNHQSRNEILLEKPVKTSSITLRLQRSLENVPISVFGVQAFSSDKIITNN